MPGRGRQQLLEGPLQVGLVGEARLQRRIGDGPALAQSRPRDLHAAVDQVACGVMP